MDRLLALYGPWDGLVVAVNDVALHIAYFDHWASLHPEKFRRDSSNTERIGWKEQRLRIVGPEQYETWSRREAGTDRSLGHTGGSSGLLGTMVACKVCRGRVVLCGIPMDQSAHFAESTVHPHNKPWGSNSAHWRVWLKPATKAAITGRVRSFSGNTRELLGEPTAAWINGGTDGDEDGA